MKTSYFILSILAKKSAVLGLDPKLLVTPATLVSCAFLITIASTTQAIVFGSGHIKIKQMIKAGILFNLLGVVIVSAVFYLLAKFVFGIAI
jgi:sodium-dependent dicarboxylate transporter 2/3/5